MTEYSFDCILDDLFFRASVAEAKEADALIGGEEFFQAIADYSTYYGLAVLQCDIQIYLLERVIGRCASEDLVLQAMTKLHTALQTCELWRRAWLGRFRRIRRSIDEYPQSALYYKTHITKLLQSHRERYESSVDR